MPLHCLVRDEKFKEVEKYAFENKDLEVKDNLGQTALFYAARHGNEVIGEALLNLGANPNTVNEEGKSLLSLVTYAENFEFADKILSAGGSINKLNKLSYHQTANPDSPLTYSHSGTALDYCIRFDRVPCIVYLIQAGADIDTKDSYGITSKERINNKLELRNELSITNN